MFQTNSKEITIKAFHEWIDFYQKNKPQTNALAAGLMIVLYGGQQLGWGIFNNHLKAQPWAGGYEDKGDVFWAIISWFIAAIVGFFLSTLAVTRCSKMSIYFSAGIVSAFSAVLFISRPESVYYVFPGRVLSGLSYGIVYPTILIHSCEVSLPRLRGMIVSTVHLCLFIGVFITSSSLLPVYKTRTYEVDPTRTIGINGLVCIVSGLVISIFLNLESPIFLIKKYEEQKAINTMIRLRSESQETSEIRRDFNEIKLMVLEDNNSTMNAFERGNLWPLSIVLFMKIVFVASFNMPLNLIWLEATEAKFYNGTTDSSGMCLSGVRWITIMIMTFAIDFKRVKFYRLSAGISMVLMSALFFAIKSSGEGLDQTTMISVLAFAFQVSSGLAVGMLSDVYSTEAFDTIKKPLSVAITSSIEFLLQIFMIATVYQFKVSLLLMVSLSGLVMAMGFFAYFIPNTSHMSLRMARNKFKL